MNKNYRNMLAMLTVGCAALMMTSIASGSTIYNLSVANCSGGGATVTATTIVWSPNGTVSNSGCIDSGIGTSVPYSGGTLVSNNIGNILDLTAGTLPVDDFMTFAGTTLDFDLTGIGPGSANTNCNLNATTNTTCSVFAGSPFILTYVSPTATAVGLGVSGTVNVLGGPAPWSGSFTTQLNETGTQIQTAEIGGGFIQSTQSGNFAVTVQSSSTPEPSSMAMLLLGGGLMAVATRRRNRTR